MGSKRPHHEVDGDSSHDRPRNKRQMTGPKRKANEDSMSWVRKRARDLERRFKKDQGSIPAHKAKELERELSAHQSRIAAAKDRKLRQKMISKYHMVRFFERKKAQRREKQLRKKLEQATDPEEKAALQADIHRAEVDVKYTMYFPHMETYISLYPAQDKDTDGADDENDKAQGTSATSTERPPMWTAVEKAMEEGTQALERLRDRRPGGGTYTPTVKTFASGSNAVAPKKRHGEGNDRSRDGDASRSSKKSGSAGRWEAEEEQASSGEESDGGGFFEPA